ncbi:MAG TPA: MarC family protein [Melioribacteraceae bacterium]|nr:MarC family protein [Melioribacteraceae bacterium]
MDFNLFLLTFIPLFVAIDIIGTTPVFLGFTEGISNYQRKKLIIEACLTAFIVALGFLFAGKAVLRFLGITINDFRIAGGLILLILSINDILSSSENRRNPHTNIGIVPLGIPLIMGPAALTTIMILNDKYGFLPTITAMLANFIIIVSILTNAKWLTKALGEGGSKAFAKIASLFLAAYGVMMIREGIANVINLL